MIEDSQLARATVYRFFHFGKDTRVKGYSLFHGPAITTIVGIAASLGLELSFRPKTNFVSRRRTKRMSNGTLNASTDSPRS